ncbi:MAG: hypothetical protein LBB94_01545 [Clostridiales bacterium]|jgi:hypothetical protein|nr:hypothetical protein [Clostridiales bacterium]
MFRIKKANAVSQIRNIEVRLNGEVLFRGNLMDLPLKEEMILKKSIEFFNDPAPCYIHKGAVTVRLLNEIWESAGAGCGAVVSEYADYPLGAVIYAMN